MLVRPNIPSHDRMKTNARIITHTSYLTRAEMPELNPPYLLHPSVLRFVLRPWYDSPAPPTPAALTTRHLPLKDPAPIPLVLPLGHAGADAHHTDKFRLHHAADPLDLMARITGPQPGAGHRQADRMRVRGTRRAVTAAATTITTTTTAAAAQGRARGERGRGRRRRRGRRVAERDLLPRVGGVAVRLLGHLPGP